MFEIRWGYFFNRARRGPTDYLVEFDHRSLADAKRSILWYGPGADGQWEKSTAATLQILKKLGLVRDGQTVLDYGCGIGRISLRLLENYRIRLIAVDRSPAMRKHFRRYLSRSRIAKKRLSDGHVVLWSDEEFVSKVSEIEGTVDLALFIEVVQHIPEPILDALIPQVVRTLRPTGRIFILGDRTLDVNSLGQEHTTTIEAFLAKRSRDLSLLRGDVWEDVELDGDRFHFALPRYSFLCSRRL